MSDKRLVIVIIGRNEGARLIRCIESARSSGAPVVYVDSGSTDGSVSNAERLGAHVIELDMKVAFTAARARNAGWRAALELVPSCQFVQFVDGDCELRPGWLVHGLCFLEANPEAAVVCGRLRERHPEASIYNLMCDFEWQGEPGEIKACGGIAMMRVEALRQSGGFREGMIAGEEPELCLRLRTEGWKVWRTSDEMAWHDAAILKFSQWWRRAVRGGYAFAEGAHLHGAPPERHWVRETRRALLWGALGPVAVAAAALSLGWKGFALALIYPAQCLRLTLTKPRHEHARWIRALFLVLGKFPEAIGVLRFHWHRLSQQPARLIE